MKMMWFTALIPAEGGGGGGGGGGGDGGEGGGSEGGGLESVEPPPQAATAKPTAIKRNSATTRRLQFESERFIRSPRKPFLPTSLEGMLRARVAGLLANC